MATRVLIVDDHPLTRGALTALLEQHDLILLDLSMPGIGGLGALPLLREAAPECEVVMLTASVAEENLLAAIRGGAAGYLLKTEPPERIVEFLRGAAEGE